MGLVELPPTCSRASRTGRVDPPPPVSCQKNLHTPPAAPALMPSFPLASPSHNHNPGSLTFAMPSSRICSCHHGPPSKLIPRIHTAADDLAPCTRPDTDHRHLPRSPPAPLLNPFEAPHPRFEVIRMPYVYMPLTTKCIGRMLHMPYGRMETLSHTCSLLHPHHPSAVSPHSSTNARSTLFRKMQNTQASAQRRQLAPHSPISHSGRCTTASRATLCSP